MKKKRRKTGFFPALVTLTLTVLHVWGLKNGRASGGVELLKLWTFLCAAIQSLSTETLSTGVILKAVCNLKGHIFIINLRQQIFL